ncbi:MAG: mechanosensitive ion channel family protein [Cuniculiplasma sp.]
MGNERRKQRFMAIGALLALLAGLLVVVYIVTEVLKAIPPSYSKFLDAAVIAIIAFLVVRMVLTYIRLVLGKFLDNNTLHPIIFMVRMVGYFIIVLAVIASLGINVSSIILGSTFLAAVIGLASQSVLANQFAGLLLIVTRPFKIGDRVWIHAWQFSITYAVVIPKYFSSDFLYNNGFVGKVKDISINYTTLVTDGGEVVKIANNVLTQGAYRVTSNTPVVQVRYEIPKYLKFDLVRDEILKELRGFKEMTGDPFLAIDETTLNTYIILIKAQFDTNDPSIIRGKIIEMLISTVERKRLPSSS